MELSVVNILRKCVEVIRNNLGTCLALVLVVVSLDLFGRLAADALFLRFVPESAPTIRTMRGFMLRAPIELFAIVVTLLSYLVAQAGMTMTVIAHTEGRTATLREALGAGLTRPIALCLGGLLTLLATVAGTLLLIVPGVLAMIAFCLTTPAILIEGLGPIEGMKRSRMITAGHEHAIFFVFLALAGINSVVSMVIVAPLALTLGFEAVGTSGPSVGFLAVATFVNALLAVFATGVFAVVYAEVRD